MSNAPAQRKKFPATLVLDGARTLTGELGARLDGRLQLEHIRMLEEVDPGTPINIAPGTEATLQISRSSEVGGMPDPARVTVSGQYQSTLALDFAPAETKLAARYHQFLIDHHATPEATATVAHTDEDHGVVAYVPTPATTPVSPATASAAPLPDRSTAPGRQPTDRNPSIDRGALLGEFQRDSLEQMTLALPPFLEDLTAKLTSLSDHATANTSMQSPVASAARIIAQSRGNITAQIVDQLADYFIDLTPLESDDQLWQYNIGSYSELGLIDLQEFEEFLAIDRMVSIGEEHYKLSLEALTLRLASLINADPNKLRLPIHVRQICRAFQRALLAQQIPQEALAPTFDYFAERFIEQLDGYYDPLNAMLAARQVRPNIEMEIQNHGYMLKRNKPKERPTRRDTGQRQRRKDPRTGEYYQQTQEGAASVASSIQGKLDQFHQQVGEQLTGVLGQVSPANLYRSVVDALNFKREAEGLADGESLARGTALSGTWDGATVASSELDQGSLADAKSIARALSALQHDSRAREDVQHSESLRAYLADHRGDIGGLQNTSGLTADSLNQLDLVDNLFGTIKSQLDVSSNLKPALGNLQIPLAKLALLDPRFFVDHSHSARAVIDKLSQLAGSANFPNRALEGRINTIVDEIVGEYENDASTFDTALAKIERLVEQQERALLRNIERVVRTQEGQEKLAQARRTTAKLIREKMAGPAAPQVILDLIEHGWSDLLVLTHVKEGPDSDAWEEQVKVLDLLSGWLDERQVGKVNEDLMIQRSMEAQPMLDLIGQQISSALPTNVAHEGVLDQLGQILAGNQDVETTLFTKEDAGVEPEPDAVRAKIEDLPRLRRWVQRVEQLNVNSWLTYRDKNDNKKRMQLAWISPARDRYIFVNERGQKVADLSSIQLARQLSRGVQPPAPSDRFSVVDRSMYHTLEHVQKTLSFARNHDSLTKLINEDVFLEQVARALSHSQRKRSQHAILFLNIDQFKLVNEVYDQITGDQVLLEFARLLAQLHGKKSSSARMEGDEFAVLLLDRSATQAMEVAEKVRADIAASSMDIEGESVSFTVSIGVVTIVEHSPDVPQIMEDARTAMQHAKNLGRDRVALFEQEQSNASEFRLEKNRIREDLEDALATERFLLRAQPIVQTAVSNSDDTSQHYELLLSLKNNDGTLSSPQEFILSAERYGFMPMVDRWVVREAFTWISGLMDAQKVVPNLAINLSGSSVTDDSFMEFLLEQISEFGVGTSRLCFEITETGTIANLVKAADFVRAFRNIGCQFSIDDFGTGLASHNYLRELPVDYVKIDGSFVTGIHKSRNDYAMARSINDLAHFLGQKTIAESVENDEIIEKLEEIGVDYLQGWGVGRPKPLTEVTTDLSNIEK